MFGSIKKIFKSKSEKDVGKLIHYVHQINSHFDAFSSLSHEQLREQVSILKNEIVERLAAIEAEIQAVQNKILQEEDFELKANYYQQIDALKKQKDEQLEAVLIEILPRAFAIVKQTAFRFKKESHLTVQANLFDKELALKKPYVAIKGDKAIYETQWEVGGKNWSWDVVHYDVQLIGGIVLHLGKIAEMATGEGKTLVSTLPAFLNALAGQSVHIVTVNDYLAKRDAEWMAPIYEFHGLAVDCIDLHTPNSLQRKKAYQAAIVYGTNNEFGFDYLRDNMSMEKDALVQQKLHFAMVDEVDSVLIDDARTPLIISGPVQKKDEQQFNEFKPLIEKLLQEQKKYVNSILASFKKDLEQNNTGEQKGGLKLFRAFRGFPKNKTLIKLLTDPNIKRILTKTENFYLQEQSKRMPFVDKELMFTIEEKNKAVNLNDKGLNFINSLTKEKDFFLLPDISLEIAKIEKENTDPIEKIRKKEAVNTVFAIKSERIHTLQQLLKAYCLFEINIDYVIEDKKVMIVDEQTGRIMEGRRYSDGLHQALEAKENVKVEDATQTYATISLQNYFRMYHKLSGMTGTAITEAGEFWKIYQLDVVTVPTNVPVIRKDQEDKIYRTIREKYKAIVDEIILHRENNRPILVGTTSVENSEIVSRMLSIKKIPHQILNAKLHKKEADIIAVAGQAKNVTIATNMAGRGTDIKLSKEVVTNGGLAIIGTEKHESRRVDRQLRGRAGRQGDPGFSQFFVSLEDSLMRLFSSDRVSKIMLRIGFKEGEMIQHSMITRSIERAQKKVEENNFGIRKRLLEYDDIINTQRNAIYEKRKNAMEAQKLGIEIYHIFYDYIQQMVYQLYDSGNILSIRQDLAAELSINIPFSDQELKDWDKKLCFEKIFQYAFHQYQNKNQLLANQIYEHLKIVFERTIIDKRMLVIPFTDGLKKINVPVDLETLMESKGNSFAPSFEKVITLAFIDDEWKFHLRNMDILRQTVQNAVYEQKDPLLIYKFEAYELFRTFLMKINKEIISYLMKSHLPIFEKQEEIANQKFNVKQENHYQNYSESKSSFSNNQEASASSKTPSVVSPIKRTAKKIGRNEKCHCGSGKKYKNCHALNSVGV